MPYEQSRNLYRTLKKRVPVEYVEVDTGAHSLDHEASREKIMTALVAFLAEHLN